MPEAKGRPTFPVRKARVGALLAIGLLLLAYAVYKVGSVFDVFASRYELHALVPSALGLREGAPVTLAGQRVGQVQSIDFIPVEQRRPDANLNVTLAVNERVRDQIRRDSRAFFRMQGLLGDKYVDIAPGTAGAAILQPGDTLAVGESVDIELFMERAALAAAAAQHRPHVHPAPRAPPAPAPRPPPPALRRSPRPPARRDAPPRRRGRAGDGLIAHPRRHRLRLLDARPRLQGARPVERR